MYILSIQDQQAGTLLPDITALLWNPPRLLYCHQEKVSRHSCDNTHPHVASTVHSLCWKAWDMPQTACTCQCVTTMCMC